MAWLSDDGGVVRDCPVSGGDGGGGRSVVCAGVVAPVSAVMVVRRFACLFADRGKLVYGAAAYERMASPLSPRASSSGRALFSDRMKRLAGEQDA
ncbi:hypothetical protein GOB93_05395 [Acetobacter musti]|uniref:Uncharacterized protein n=1 Tax=Acetobacter musti TaxID=864732 RepID=A0ABX0JLH0_9PROT|nr:hypothetical protein [Acetobacter musti]NHN84077.1 hypothetical protein [Acetobacter musti]